MELRPDAGRVARGNPQTMMVTVSCPVVMPPRKKSLALRRLRFP